MKPVVLGTRKGSPPVHLDVEQIVHGGRGLLIQGNSGSGKSRTIRRILEQTNDQLQHIVLDPEGEFSTLRERYDYVLASKAGGDTAANPRSAVLLAERLMEIRVSAVIDLYELKGPDRIAFMQRFLEALVETPKKLWHPVLVVVDEAHVFCPEGSKAESAQAVKDLSTRGRKRGLSPIFATQRLSAFAKDAAGNCNNKLIGRTVQDTDLKRAADELGFGKDRWPDLRNLDAGQFFAYGPALSNKEIVLVQVGDVTTSHPSDTGVQAAAVARTSPKLLALLPKLADLPAEAEQRARTVADLQAEVSGLKRDLARAERDAAPAEVVEIEIPVLGAEVVARLEAAVESVLAAADPLAGAVGTLRAAADAIRTGLSEATDKREKGRAAGTARPAAPQGASRPRPAAARPVSPADTVLCAVDAGEQRILNTLRMLEVREIPRDRVALARWMRIHPNGGRFNRQLASLRAKGHVDGIELTADGRAMADLGETGPDAAVAAVKGNTTRNVLKEIAKSPTSLGREDLAAKLGIHPNGGRFNRDLAWLRAMGLIPERGRIETTDGYLR